MSTITLSSNLQNAIVNSLFEVNGYPSITSGSIQMMKGTVPTAIVDAYRPSDILWSKTISTSDGTLVNGLWTLSTAYAIATQSGTATWFLLSNSPGGSNVSNGNSSAIIGTIGASGSGADLTLDSTTILSGAWYRVYNLKFTIPTTYTY